MNKEIGELGRSGQHKSGAKHLSFAQSCHSVFDAAAAAGGDPKDIVKSICMIDAEQNMIVAIVKGEDHASNSRVAKALNVDRSRIATPEEILAQTGYPCGGTPSFGFSARFVVDSKVLDEELVYTGAVRILLWFIFSHEALLKLNQGKVARNRK